MTARGPALLHLSMHGSPEGFAFEIESGESKFIDTMIWPKTVQNRPELQLIVMDSCSTAGCGTDEQGYSLFGSSPCASALQVGVPAVIAMRYPVLMTASRVYMVQFYRNLFEMSMTLEEAHREAVRRLHDDLDRDKFTEWGWLTPVLYMHVNHINAGGYSLKLGKSGKGSDFIPDPARPPLPAPVEHFRHFVGKRKEMRDILKSCRPGTTGNLFILHGSGGMGKTQLAVGSAT